MDLPELQAFSSIQEGSETAFEMLFRTYYQPLCQYAYSFLNDRDEAEEVVQSAFITIWDKRSSLEIHSSPKSYLYQMVRNGSLNRIKHLKVRKEHLREEMAAGEPTVEGAPGLMSNELESKIAEAMKALPEQCRLIFQLSRFEQLKYAEIAEQLKISVKTVENQVGKALKIMREQLKDYLVLVLLTLNDWL